MTSYFPPESTPNAPALDFSAAHAAPSAARIEAYIVLPAPSGRRPYLRRGSWPYGVSFYQISNKTEDFTAHPEAPVYVTKEEALESLHKAFASLPGTKRVFSASAIPNGGYHLEDTIMVLPYPVITSIPSRKIFDEERTLSTTLPTNHTGLPAGLRFLKTPDDLGFNRITRTAVRKYKNRKASPSARGFTSGRLPQEPLSKYYNELAGLATSRYLGIADHHLRLARRRLRQIVPNLQHHKEQVYASGKGYIHQKTDSFSWHNLKIQELRFQNPLARPYHHSWYSKRSSLTIACEESSSRPEYTDFASLYHLHYTAKELKIYTHGPSQQVLKPLLGPLLPYLPAVAAKSNTALAHMFAEAAQLLGLRSIPVLTGDPRCLTTQMKALDPKPMFSSLPRL